MNPSPMVAISNTMVLSGRMLKHNIRSVDTIMTVVAMPLMIMLAFVFVLGGAMQTGPMRYVDYVVPVVLLFCIASGVSYTAFRVNQDVTTGMFDRFRTMPIARSAMVGGHIVASVVSNAASVVIILAFALLFGYRPHAGVVGWLVMVALLLATLVSFTVMGAAFGLLAKTNEGAGMFSYLVMGLLFVSSGFAPTSSMKAGLRAFADHQPMTPIINAMRGAQFGQIDAGTTWLAFGWLAAMVIVFAVLAALAGGCGKKR